MAHYLAASANCHRVAEQPGGGEAMFGVSEIQEIAKKLFKLQLECTQNSALNIEVIEDTILIDASIVGKRGFHNKRRQEREKKAKTKPKTKKKNQPRPFPQKKQLYSRHQLEALRFADLDDQRNKWAAVYHGLPPEVAAEYDGMVKPAAGFDRRPHIVSAEAMGGRRRGIGK